MQTSANIINRACTFLRVTQSLRDILDDVGDSFQKTNVFLVSINLVMDSLREYRVFCPSLIERISTTPRYRWHERSDKKNLEDFVKCAERIYKNSTNIYVQTIRHVKQLKNVSVKEKMQSEDEV